MFLRRQRPQCRREVRRRNAGGRPYPDGVGNAAMRVIAYDDGDWRFVEFVQRVGRHVRQAAHVDARDATVVVYVLRPPTRG